jgi:hypothetical protein
MTSLMEALKPDAIIKLVATDLMEAYEFAEDWGDRDALKKVIKLYTTPAEYRLFKELYIES